MWQEDVTHLEVDQAVHQPAGEHAAAADPRADGIVNERVAPHPTHNAAAFTSVSNATGMFSARRIVPTTSVLRQPSFGVLVIRSASAG
jgi:hypothetical protein